MGFTPIMAGKFHQSRQWRRLSKEFKTQRCYDCGSSKELQAGHVLAASKFPMSALWRSNLKMQCATCNQKQGTKLKLDLKTIKLLMEYAVIKTLKVVVMSIIVILFFRFVYLDITYNGSTISNQMKYDTLEYWDKLIELLQSEQRSRVS